jgi:hypothetical protein
MTNMQLHEHAVQSPGISASRIEWAPLDEHIQRWANFGAEASTPPALIATGQAFLALSWEASASRHYAWAQQERRYGSLRAYHRWMQQSGEDLDEALKHWRRVILWVERLANSEPAPGEDALDDMRTLFAHTMEQQQWVWTLMLRVREEEQGAGNASSLNSGGEAPAESEERAP